MIRAREEKPGLAIALMVLCVACFTGIDTSAKWLGLAGLPVLVAVFIRFLVHFLIVVGEICLAWDKDDPPWRMHRPGLVILRGLMLLCATVANFNAVQFLPLTVTVSILFISPLVVTVLAAIFLGETIGLRRWIAIFTGLAGVLIVTRPWGASFHPAMLLSLIPPLATAVYALATRRLSGVETAATMQFWAALVPTIAIAPFALSQWAWPTDGLSWAAFLLVGLFGYIGHQFYTLAHRYAEASALAPISYTQIVFMTLSSWLIFHQPPDVITLLGGAVIVASGLYVWLRERKAKQR